MAEGDILLVPSKRWCEHPVTVPSRTPTKDGQCIMYRILSFINGVEMHNA